MKRLVRNLFRDERAATAVEYGLICACVVLAMLVGLIALGGTVRETWGTVDNQVAAAH